MITKLFLEKSEIQSILFDKTKWTTAKAKEWAKKKDFKYGNVDVTDKYIRFRQKDPKKYDRMRISDEKSKGIKFIYGFK